MIEEKRCRRCDVVKPLASFYAQPAGKFGRTPRCIECIKIEHREYKNRITPDSMKAVRSRKQSLLAQGLVECTKCQEVKPVDEYFRSSAGRRSQPCKQCSMQKHREWKAANADHMLAYMRAYSAKPDVAAKKRQRKIDAAAASPRWVMQITLRHGLKRRPTDNPATIDDLMAKFEQQGGRCAVTGILMTWRKGKVLPTSISLDRVDHDGGYSAQNIRLICHAVNAFRGRMTDEQMFDMALAIVANMKRPKLRLVS